MAKATYDTDLDNIVDNAEQVDGYEAVALAVIAEARTISGLWTYDRGANPPFAVDALSLVVANLDVDLVDGCDAGVAASEVFKIPAGIASGDIFYVDATPNIVRLAKGSDTEVLTLAAGLPSWAAPSGGGGLGVWLQHSYEGIAAGSTYYAGVDVHYATSEVEAQIIIPKNCTVKNLYVNVPTNSLSGNLDITIRKGGADQTTTVQYTTGQTGVKSDTSNTFAASAGDILSIKLVAAAGTGSADNISIGVELA